MGATPTPRSAEAGRATVPADGRAPDRGPELCEGAACKAEAARRVAVAFSGGRDSTALLHAVTRALRGSGVEVVALHVHHGLVAEADAWVAHARRLCARWRRGGSVLRLRVACLDGKPAAGESVEAWARRERYAALARMAREEGASLVLLAHHRRDQAETVLLQALRGAGPAGLAAMPRVAQRDGLSWARPWLGQPREAIDAYIARNRLRPIEDPSNADRRYARNRLRHDVWPAFARAFAQAEQALAGVAARAAAAAQVLQEVAALDLRACAESDALRVEHWLALSPARRENALRAWCRLVCGAAVPQSLLDRLAAELPTARAGRWPVPGGMLHLYRGRLGRLEEPADDGAPPPAVQIDLSRPGCYPVPGWGGSWQVTSCRCGGIAAAELRGARMQARSGGESFTQAPGGMPRALKKQFQAAGLASVERRGPLLWAGQRLLFVAGLGVDAHALAAAGVAQRRLAWVFDSAAPHVDTGVRDRLG